MYSFKVRQYNLQQVCGQFVPFYNCTIIELVEITIKNEVLSGCALHCGLYVIDKPKKTLYYHLNHYQCVGG